MQTHGSDDACEQKLRTHRLPEAAVYRGRKRQGRTTAPAKDIVSMRYTRYTSKLRLELEGNSERRGSSARLNEVAPHASVQFTKPGQNSIVVRARTFVRRINRALVETLVIKSPPVISVVSSSAARGCAPRLNTHRPDPLCAPRSLARSSSTFETHRARRCVRRMY